MMTDNTPDRRATGIERPSGLPETGEALIEAAVALESDEREVHDLIESLSAMNEHDGTAPQHAEREAWGDIARTVACSAMLAATRLMGDREFMRVRQMVWAEVDDITTRGLSRRAMAAKFRQRGETLQAGFVPRALDD